MTRDPHETPPAQPESPELRQTGAPPSPATPADPHRAEANALLVDSARAPQVRRAAIQRWAPLVALVALALIVLAAVWLFPTRKIGREPPPEAARPERETGPSAAREETGRPALEQEPSGITAEEGEDERADDPPAVPGGASARADRARDEAEPTGDRWLERSMTRESGAVAEGPAAGPAVPPRPRAEVGSLDRSKPRELRAPTPPYTAPAPVAGRELSPSEIRAVVNAHEQDVASCLKDPQNYSRANKLELAVRVQPSGAVSEAIKRRPIGPDAVADCISLKVRSWRFPAPGGTAAQEVVVPFVVVPGTEIAEGESG